MIRNVERFTYALACHGEIRAVLVTRDGMSLTSFDNEVKQAGRRSNLRNCKGLDGEKADDDGDDKGVEVISQEGSFDTTDKRVQDDADGEQKGRCDDVHSGSVLVSHNSTHICM
jgi:hypothetical protein